jgi:hypothetical protein
MLVSDAKKWSLDAASRRKLKLHDLRVERDFYRSIAEFLLPKVQGCLFLLFEDSWCARFGVEWAGEPKKPTQGIRPHS